MTNPWFKFYGAEYLSDPKIATLSPQERSCWVTLLCLAASSSTPGTVEYLTVEVLLQKSGITWDPYNTDEWDNALSALEKFARMKMIVKKEDGTIIITNWAKRQEKALTNAERQAKYRERNEKVTEPVTKVTLEKKRVEKKRVEKRETHSLSYLEKLPEQDLQELSTKYKVSLIGIQSKATDLKLYCQSRDKRYKNYRAFLENALRKDHARLRQEYPPPTPVSRPEPNAKPMSPEQIAEMKKMGAALVRKLKI
jgi:hypothetical protein